MRLQLNRFQLLHHLDATLVDVSSSLNRLLTVLTIFIPILVTSLLLLLLLLVVLLIVSVVRLNRERALLVQPHRQRERDEENRHASGGAFGGGHSLGIMGKDRKRDVCGGAEECEGMIG